MQQIAGYRIVRRLSSTAREEVAIGRGATGGVLIRRLSEPIPPSRERAVEAQAAAGERPHIAAVRDLAIDADGTLVVVTDIVAGPSVREVLNAREWALGHAVTLLVPLVRTLADLHEEGITVGRVDVDAIRLDSTGAPTIVDWSEAVATPPLPPRLRSQDAHYGADHDAVGRLVAAVAEVLPVSDAERLRGVFAANSGEIAVSGEELAERLFSLADPLPLLGEASAVLEPAPAPTHREPDSAPPLDRQRTAPTPMIPPIAIGTIGRVSGAMGLPPALVSALEGAVSGVADRLRGLRERAARLPRRRLLLVTLATAVGLAIAVTSLLDQGGAGDAVPLVGGTSGDAPSVLEDDAESDVSEGEPMGDDAEGMDGAPAPLILDLPDPQDSDWVSIVEALVREWERCARDGERLCDTALHRESAVADARLHGEDEPEVTRLAALVDADPDVLITERMGAAVILEITAPDTTAASLLVMRSEAGWRVRDVLD